MPNLPQSFYDDLANASLPVVNVPAGTWTVPPIAPIVINRSNVTVNFAGCVIETHAQANPWSNTHYPIKAWSTTDSTGVPNGRTVSRVTGQITPSTTSLTMAEVVTVTPGETVLIHAGVNVSDPAEPETYIVAEVASVSGTVITFAQPLGKSIAVYASFQQLQGLTSPSNHYKIGPWGQTYEGGLYSKGLGLDHGLERFVGGMLHDITINDLDIRPTYPETITDFPNGNWLLSSVATNRLRVNRMTVTNCTGAAVHLWRSFDVQITKTVVQGNHISKVWNQDFFEAAAFTIWGGDNIDIVDTTVRGKDCVLITQEVSPNAVTFRGVDVDVEFTARRTYSGGPNVIGFYASRQIPNVRNASIKFTHTGGQGGGYMSLNQINFGGTLRIPEPLGAYFQTSEIAGTPLYSYERLIIGGKHFGPRTTQAITVEITSNETAIEYQLPQGIYTRARVRGIAIGGATSVTDGHGSNLFASLSGGAWTNLSEHWFRLVPGAGSVDAYLSAKKFTGFFGIGTAGQVTRFEFSFDYHPLITRNVSDRLSCFAATSINKRLLNNGAPLLLKLV